MWMLKHDLRLIRFKDCQALKRASAAFYTDMLCGVNGMTVQLMQNSDYYHLRPQKNWILKGFI